MKGQKCGRSHANRNLPDSARIEKERPESEQDPIAYGQVRRALACPPEDDQLLLEQEVLSDHRADAAGSAKLRDHNSQMEESEQGSVHTETRVGSPSGDRNASKRLNFSVNYEFETDRLL